MGRTKAKRKPHSGSKRAHKSTTKSGTSTHNTNSQKSEVKEPSVCDKVNELLEKVESYISTFQYDIAIEFCKQAVNADPNNPKALEMLAGLLLEFGELENAKSTLLHAVELHPNEGHSKFFSLGQLSEGLESLEFYRKGIDVILSHLQTLESMPNSEEQSKNVSTLKNELSNAYCAMAETYMTDLCFEKDAEENSKLFSQKSIEADPSNPDAYQCFANFLLVTGDVEEAKSSMQKSLKLWLPQSQSLTDGTDVESVNSMQFSPPSYDSRLNGSKLLIELEMYDEAIEVLEGLIEEDDEVVSTWYLLGWLNYLRGEENWENAAFYFQKVKKVAVKTQKGDEDQIVHAAELLSQINAGNENSSSDDDDKENGDVDDFPSDSDDELEEMEH